MDTDYDFLCDSDSRTEFGDEDDFFCLDTEDLTDTDKLEYYEDFHYDILSSEDIVDDMLKLIKEVNTIVEVRILLQSIKVGQNVISSNRISNVLMAEMPIFYQCNIETSSIFLIIIRFSYHIYR